MATNFLKSENPKKLYSIITPSGKLLDFGTQNKPIYKDRTDLMIYTHLNHYNNDKRNKMLKKLTEKRNKEGLLKCLDAEDPVYYEVNYLW